MKRSNVLKYVNLRLQLLKAKDIEYEAKAMARSDHNMAGSREFFLCLSHTALYYMKEAAWLQAEVDHLVGVRRNHELVIEQLKRDLSVAKNQMESIISG
jgi:hypothetical protein